MSNENRYYCQINGAKQTEFKLDGKNINKLHYGRRVFERQPTLITNALLSVSKNLLNPDASIVEKLTFIGYQLVDGLHPWALRETSIDFFHDQTRMIGFVFTWHGSKYKRQHVYLPKELALQYLDYLRKNTANGEKIALSLIIEDDKMKTLDGFNPDEFEPPSDSGWQIMQPRKKGTNPIEIYTRMYLTKPALEKREDYPQLLETIPQFRVHRIPLELPEFIRSKLSPELLEKLKQNLTLGRLSSYDFSAAEKLHIKNNPHSSIKSYDLINLNLGIFLGDDKLIAMGGYSSMASVMVAPNTFCNLYLAANLAVDKEWQECGIGESLSLFMKRLIFNDDEGAIIMADNVPATEHIWKKFGASKVARLGWVVWERKNSES